MSASSTRALTRRSHAALMLVAAIAGAVALTIVVTALGGTAARPVAKVRGPVPPNSAFVKVPLGSATNAGYGLNDLSAEPARSVSAETLRAVAPSTPALRSRSR